MEWRAFETLEPFAEERADYNMAHVVQALARDGKPLKDFLIPFGDTVIMPTRQTVAYQEQVLDAWFAGSNEILRPKGARK